MWGYRPYQGGTRQGCIEEYPMPRVSCPDCSHPVSPEEVAVCPQCGYPIREVYYGGHEPPEEKGLPSPPSPESVPGAGRILRRALHVGCVLVVTLLVGAVLLMALLVSVLVKQC